MTHKALTDRELEIVRLAAEGFSYKEIAEELGIRFSTVKTHASRVLSKLNASSMTHSVAILFQEGLLS